MRFLSKLFLHAFLISFVAIPSLASDLRIEISEGSLNRFIGSIEARGETEGINWSVEGLKLKIFRGRIRAVGRFAAFVPNNNYRLLSQNQNSTELRDIIIDRIRNPVISSEIQNHDRLKFRNNILSESSIINNGDKKGNLLGSQSFTLDQLQAARKNLLKRQKKTMFFDLPVLFSYSDGKLNIRILNSKMFILNKNHLFSEIDLSDFYEISIPIGPFYFENNLTASPVDVQTISLNNRLRINFSMRYE